jgi:anthranilate synthase component 1
LSRELPGTRDLLALAAAFPQRYPGLLESAARGAQARWDILFAFPGDALVLHPDGRVRDVGGIDRGGRFLEALDRACGEGISTPAEFGGLPFTAGWLLYLGY